jgi:K+-transporting ATPase ATPase B chain
MAAAHAVFVPFTAQTRMSGVDFAASNGRPARSVRKGAASNVKAWVESQGGDLPGGGDQAWTPLRAAAARRSW